MNNCEFVTYLSSVLIWYIRKLSVTKGSIFFFGLSVLETSENQNFVSNWGMGRVSGAHN